MKPSEIVPKLKEGQKVRVTYEGTVTQVGGRWRLKLRGAEAVALILDGSQRPIPVDVVLVPENVWLRVKPAGVIHCVSYYHDGFAKTLCNKTYDASELTDKYPFATASCGNCKTRALGLDSQP